MKYYKRDIIERKSAVYFGLWEKFYVYSPFYRNGNQKKKNEHNNPCCRENKNLNNKPVGSRMRSNFTRFFTRTHYQTKTTACIYDLDLLPF